MEEEGVDGLIGDGVLSTWHSLRLYLLAVSVVILAYRLLRKRQTSGSDDFISTKTFPAETSKEDRLVDKEKNSETVTPLLPLKQKPAQTAAAPKRVRGVKPSKNGTSPPVGSDNDRRDKTTLQPLIFFSSLTGTTAERAKKIYEQFRLVSNGGTPTNADAGAILEPQIHDLSYIDFDDFFVSPPKQQNPNTLSLYCIILPTYDIDSIITNFLAHLEETHHDFRIDTAPLSGLGGYAVFGLGDKEGWPTEEEGFCSQAREVDKWMAKLTSRKRAYPLGVGDVKSDGQAALQEWANGLCDVMKDVVLNGGGLGEGVSGSGDAVESDDEDVDDEAPVQNTSKRPKRNNAQIMDLEDIKFGPSKPKQNTTSAESGSIAIDFTTYSKTGAKNSQQQQQQQQQPKEMVPVTSPTHAALTKQGYTIIGSHSGVKICRWTKSALRGRGSCYKNSFYGIKSHLCMETTPALSCSNKCVFCWRHGTNPVGTTWRWQVDPPDMIFRGAKEGHYKKIKMMRGVPGVRAERFAEAMRIRHCALSLVGEPIFYPRINEFVDMLHAERISSFLVCNAQHPEQLEALHRVTQLYVSIDASNKDSLRKIDRPLHRDFWERFQRCLDTIREKRAFHRTVYRFTLVKGFNVEEEVMGYADLVEKGMPCFVEIKGVTYCGTSSSAGAGLTMKNVPFYEEVAEFATELNAELNRRGLDYGIGAEHAHSCCILLASGRFYVNGKWHTQIDYERFFELLERENADGTSFTPEDYMKATEEWALWGNGGFDPNDERVYTRGKNKKKAQAQQAQQEQPTDS